MIGTDAVAKSAPDGQTIGMVITAHMINPTLNAATIPYDTLKDLAYVTQMVTQHVVLVANTNVPFNTMKDMIACICEIAPGEAHLRLAGDRDRDAPGG